MDKFKNGRSNNLRNYHIGNIIISYINVGFRISFCNVLKIEHQRERPL